MSDLAGSMAFDWTLFFLILDTIRETFFGIKAEVNTGYFCHNSIFSLWNDMLLITLKSYVNNSFKTVLGGRGDRWVIYSHWFSNLTGCTEIYDALSYIHCSYTMHSNSKDKWFANHAI